MNDLVQKTIKSVSRHSQEKEVRELPKKSLFDEQRPPWPPMSGNMLRAPVKESEQKIEIDKRDEEPNLFQKRNHQEVVSSR